MRDHGTHACFVHGPNPGSVKGGCRCEPCRQANAAYERQRSRRTAPPYVAADRARHMAKVRAAQPKPDTTVCEVCGFEAMNRGGLASHRWAAHGLRMGAA